MQNVMRCCPWSWDGTDSYDILLSRGIATMRSLQCPVKHCVVQDLDLENLHKG